MCKLINFFAFCIISEIGQETIKDMISMNFTVNCILMSRKYIHEKKKNSTFINNNKSNAFYSKKIVWSRWR